MDYEFLNNTVSRWLLAVGLALALYTVATLARCFVVRRLAMLARRTHTKLDDLAMRTLGSTYRLALALLALYAGTLVLDLPARIETIAARTAVITFLIQVAVWGDKGVRSWRVVYHGDAGPVSDGNRRGSMSILCLGMRLTLWLVISLMILDNLGVNITTLVTSLGIGGIAVALAVQNILGDLFASLSIMLDKPFAVGDFIVVGDAMGTVEMIGLKTTRVHGLGGEQIIFSNADLLKSRIHNQQRMQTRRVAFILRVTYGTSEEQLRAIPDMVREAVNAEPAAIFERVHFCAFGVSSLDFEAVYHVNSADYLIHMDTQQAIFLTLFGSFCRAGIEFAQPTQVVRLVDEGAAAVEGGNAGEGENLRRLKRSANMY
jgi:small-conductance mechanosensitive channel